MAIARCLTIAGSDSGGGAGIQADLKTFAALGVYGMSAIAALTAQNTLGVQDVLDVDPAFVSRQIHSVVSDMGVDAVKTGMLPNSEIIACVSRDLRELGVRNLVVDPVMRATGGEPLMRGSAVDALVGELFPLALLVSPNLREAGLLAGFEVCDLEGMREAARAISALGPRFVVVKGGHLPGKPLDLLFDGRNFKEYHGVRHEGPDAHGTGCAFASAIAAGVAKGLSVEEAVGLAKEFVAGAIRHGFRLGAGRGLLHHFHALYTGAGFGFE
jgi:hydroxymethylpyrimidine/phosphomethylpyrimidine kinase